MAPSTEPHGHLGFEDGLGIAQLEKYFKFTTNRGVLGSLAARFKYPSVCKYQVVAIHTWIISHLYFQGTRNLELWRLAISRSHVS